MQRTGPPPGCELAKLLGSMCDKVLCDTGEEAVVDAAEEATCYARDVYKVGLETLALEPQPGALEPGFLRAIEAVARRCPVVLNALLAACGARVDPGAVLRAARRVTGKEIAEERTRRPDLSFGAAARPRGRAPGFPSLGVRRRDLAGQTILRISDSIRQA